MTDYDPASHPLRLCRDGGCVGCEVDNFRPGSFTDLTWLTSDDPTVHVYGTRLASRHEYLFWCSTPGVPPVRLCWSDNGDRLLINGQDEDREDFMALLGALEMVDDDDVEASYSALS